MNTSRQLTSRQLTDADLTPHELELVRKMGFEAEYPAPCRVIGGLAAYEAFERQTEDIFGKEAGK